MTRANTGTRILAFFQVLIFFITLHNSESIRHVTTLLLVKRFVAELRDYLLYCL